MVLRTGTTLFLAALLAPGVVPAAQPARGTQVAVTAALPGPLFEDELRNCFERSLLLLDGALSFDVEIPLRHPGRVFTMGGGFGLGGVVSTDRAVREEDEVVRRRFPTAVGWRRYLGESRPLYAWDGRPQRAMIHSYLSLQSGWAIGLWRDEKLDVGPHARLGAGMDIGDSHARVRVELSVEGRSVGVPAGKSYVDFCPSGCVCWDDPLAASGLWLGLSVGVVSPGDVWRDVLMP